MRLHVVALRIFTIFGAGLGIVNGIFLSGLYVIIRPYGMFYFPPLNYVGETWIIFGMIGILAGGFFIVASLSRIARNLGVWLLGFGVYATLVILSIYQMYGYFANASYGGEAGYGLIGAIVGICLCILMATQNARSFFSPSRKSSEALTRSMTRSARLSFGNLSELLLQ